MIGTAEKIEALTEKVVEQDRIIFYLRDQLRWRKVEDELPPDISGVCYWVMVEGKYSSVAEWFIGKELGYWITQEGDEMITHWLPIPPPLEDE